MEIRASIDQARHMESESNSLHNYVLSRIPALHHTIQLSGNDSAETLIDFLTRYIEHVPDFLDALIELAKSVGIYNLIDKIVNIAQSFFISPPDLLNDHNGLHALVDEAYLAHRLMEEVNDRIMAKCGMPLIPMDMTLSNIIVHNVLGEDFANQLDLAVHYSIEVLFQDMSELNSPEFRAYVALHKAEGWTDMLNEWPCLAGDNSITLSLEDRPDPSALH